jgi:hypothetical protein
MWGDPWSDGGNLFPLTWSGSVSSAELTQDTPDVLGYCKRPKSVGLASDSRVTSFQEDADRR